MVDRSTLAVRKRIDLGRYGTEIYDLAVLENVELPDAIRSVDPVELKVRHLEWRAMELEAHLRRAEKNSPAGWIKALRRQVNRLLGRA